MYKSKLAKIMMLSLFVLSTSASLASNISASYNGNFRSSDLSILRLDIHRSQQSLARYLSQNLGCTNVTLCLSNVIEPRNGLFKSKAGSFTASLSASCKAEFTNFKFDIAPAWDWEDYTDSLVGYTQDSRWIEKDLVARTNGEDFRQASSVVYTNNCDSSPVDFALPYHIITDQNLLRTFKKD